MKDQPSDIDTPLTLGRRDLLKTWGPAALAGAAITALGAGLSGRPGRHQRVDSTAALTPPDWRTDPSSPGRVAIAGGEGPRANLARALAAMGGIGEFISPGDRVAIKPNCAWDRSAAQAANTDPELIGELVRLSLAAGAASVVVLDNTWP